MFLDLVTPNIELALDALNTDGKVHTLSTPKLLALEDQEAEVVIGDRIGYKLVTTINQVTSESIDFLESGVILKVKPSIDSANRILLEIHPEVSNGTVSNGIPSQTTTEVTTQVLVEDAQTVFIGGLIKKNRIVSKQSIPGLGDIPFLGRLFSSDEETNVNTETVVLITPRIVRHHQDIVESEMERISQVEKIMDARAQLLDEKIIERGDDKELLAKHKTTNQKPNAQLVELLNIWSSDDEVVW